MATITDLLPQYQGPLKAIQAAQKAIINVVADTTEGATGQQKANKIAKFHIIMQDSVTQIEKFLVSEGAANLEDLVAAEADKPIVEETPAASP